MRSVHIPPYPPMKTPNIQVVEGALNAEQVKLVRDFGEELLLQEIHPGRVGREDVSRLDPKRRIVDGQWFPWPWESDRTVWMYEAFSEILQQVNARVWQIEVTDWVDQFHYLRYKKGGHFKWHMDKGDGWRRVERKLSFTLMLSARDEYEGGDFQFFDGEPQTIKKLGPGDMVVFPGYVQHQVTRVTKGVRRSLVAWASGPKFK